MLQNEFINNLNDDLSVFKINPDQIKCLWKGVEDIGNRNFITDEKLN